MKKFFKGFVISILAIILLLFVIEASIWFYENEKLKQANDPYRELGMLKFHPGIKPAEVLLEYFPNPNENWGRAPEGLEYKGKPIVFFGGEYTYGLNLEKEETLPYKFAHLAKRPTYNRALTSWGIQHMLYQSKSKHLYKQVPEPEYIIFTHISDHFRRLYLLSFDRGYMLEENLNVRYKEKNGELVQIKNIDPFLQMVKRLYLTNKLHQLYVNKHILRDLNSENFHNFALKHFAESKKEMQKHWKNAKFVIFIYDDLYDNDEYIENLKKEGFIVIKYDEITNENMIAPKYRVRYNYPNEKAWDLLTPKIIEKLGI